MRADRALLCFAGELFHRVQELAHALRTDAQTDRAHLLLEGIAIASWALGVHTAYVYSRGEFKYPSARLDAAIADAWSTALVVDPHGALQLRAEPRDVEALVLDEHAEHRSPRFDDYAGWKPGRKNPKEEERAPQARVEGKGTGDVDGPVGNHP